MLNYINKIKTVDEIKVIIDDRPKENTVAAIISGNKK